MSVDCRDRSNACEHPPAIAVCVFCQSCDRWVIAYVSLRQSTVCPMKGCRQTLTAPMERLDGLNGRLDLEVTS